MEPKPLSSNRCRLWALLPIGRKHSDGGSRGDSIVIKAVLLEEDEPRAWGSQGFGFPSQAVNRALAHDHSRVPRVGRIREKNMNHNHRNSNTPPPQLNSSNGMGEKSGTMMAEQTRSLPAASDAVTASCAI